ncbi:MAG: NAD(P)/FAD-dependent oxidoreductase [Nevskiaceae bacterium]|nr:MAG: NAD(P)/FAD-dependent oxidoreductase [Nevskiaceae bacterium]
MTPSALSQHVVIVGGGFAGLHAAKRLGKAGCRVTLLDKRNFQLFQPLLYQVATGSLPPGDIAIPQRVVLRKYPTVRAIQATAYDVDPQARVLRHEHGELQYDTLIVATGVKHSYFGKDQWKPFAPGLKTVEHAIEIRHKIFKAFELAEVTEDPAERARLMTFVIVGGGPTGVELAGAIGELAHKTMVKDFRAIDPRAARIILVEGAAGVLPVYDRSLRDAARQSLEQLGVTVMTETRVEDIGERSVRIRRGDAVETIDCGTVLWAAGVTASAFGQILAERTGAERDRGGRVMVNPDCSLPGHDNIFVVGDLAKLKDAAGHEVPGLAQGAIQEGQYVANLLLARARGKTLAPFRYKDLGSMAVIGMNHAVGDLRLFKVRGIVGWFIWAFVHVASLVAPEQRVSVFLEWAWKYLTRRQGDRLITTNPTNTQRLRAERLAPGRNQAA